MPNSAFPRGRSACLLWIGQRNFAYLGQRTHTESSGTVLDAGPTHTNTPSTMRSILFGLLFAPMAVDATAPLRVEVHTTPRTVIRSFTLCEGVRNAIVGTEPMSEITEGTATWHVSGGVPPYTLVHLDRGLSGIVTVVVRDQEGSEARGVGYIAVNHMERRLPCPEIVLKEEDLRTTVGEPAVEAEDDDERGRRVRAGDRMDVPRPARLGSETRSRERLDVPREQGPRREYNAPRPPRQDPAPGGLPVHRSGSVQPVQRNH